MSLKSRMAARAEQLQGERTEIFPIPGYDDLVGVELRSLTYTVRNRITRRNERERNEALRDLYNFADQAIAATVGFYEPVDKDDDEWIPMPGESWVSMCRAAHPDFPEDGTPRQAFLRLVPQDRVDNFAMEYFEWVNGSLPVESEVVRDFETTQSPS